MLAAGFRLKYPHVAIGALASSAPILQFDDITPWSSFYDAVPKDYKDVSLNCYEVIKGSWQELEALSAQKFGLAMVNYLTEANFMMPLPGYSVQAMYKIIDGLSSPRATKLSKVFAAASLYYNYSQTEKCFDIENGTDAHGLHGWDWQACKEMKEVWGYSSIALDHYRIWWRWNRGRAEEIR
ncbi:lysosomal Pro-Xaa carboxypeptidase [Sarracenia purpurea var. burkii]